MSKPRIPLRVVSLAALVSTTWAIPTNDLFGRQSSTCPANSSRCSQGDLPDNFCCPSNTTCISLAADTTILCCPGTSDCTRIQPISCNITLQDVDQFPGAVIKTTALRGELGRCGSGTCCPFGYLCNSGSQCVKNINQNVAPVQMGSPSTTSSSPSPTRTNTDASPTDSSSDQKEEPPTEDNSRKGPPVAVIAGASVGAVAAVLGVGALAFLLVKKKKNNDENSEMSDTLKLTRSTSSFGNFISNPIVAEDSTLRTDFGRLPTTRKPGDGDSSILQSPESLSAFPRPPSATQQRNVAARQSSIAYGYAAPATSPFLYSQNLHPDDNTLVPETPKRGQEREPSSVSINVFADPRTLTPESANNNLGYAERYNRMTTFTQMMEEADLGGVARGQSYVPYRPGSASQQGSPSVTKKY